MHFCTQNPCPSNLFLSQTETYRTCLSSSFLSTDSPDNKDETQNLRMKIKDDKFHFISLGEIGANEFRYHRKIFTLNKSVPEALAQHIFLFNKHL